MAHHYSDEFEGFRECNECGDMHHIDDLSSDLLCENCEKAHCQMCRDKYSINELVEDHEIGLVCEGCASWLAESRTEKHIQKFEDAKINLSKLHPVFMEICNSFI